jgi:hypothetical protein
MLESFGVLLWPDIGLQVRVFQTLVDAMANLFTALTSLILQLFKPFLFDFLRVFEFLFCVGCLVETELTARLVFPPLSAAPPYLPAPLRLVHPTAPIKVLFLLVLFPALLTLLQTRFKFTFPLQQLEHLLL